VLVDLATMLIDDGGERVSDLGALADQPDLLGQIASHSTRVADPARNRCPGAGGDPLGAGGSARTSVGSGRPTCARMDFARSRRPA
jgi:hypothetical protein